MSLARKAAGAAFWVGLTTYVSQIVGFLANIALMRLIAPEAFGVLSLAMTIVIFGRKVIGFGFNYALIHRQEELPNAVGAHLTLNAASAILIFGASLVATPIVGHFYDRLTALVLVGVALEAAFEYAGYTPRLLLEKEVNFRGLMLVNLGVTIGVNLLAVGLAWGWPHVWFLRGLPIVWALVVRLALSQLATTVGYWWLNRRIPLARPSLAMLRWFFQFGAPLWISGVASFAVYQWDNWLVGTIIDEKALGFYDRAYQLALLPTTMVTGIVARVAFPLYSQLQRDRERLSEAFATVVRLIVLLSAPAAVGLAFCAPEFVSVVFGAKWAPMATLLRLLLLYQVMRPLFDDAGELFAAVGQPRLISRIQLWQTGVMALLTPAAVYSYKAEGAAVAVGVVMLVGVVLAYRNIRPFVTMNVWRVIVLPIGLCLAAAGPAEWALGRLPPAAPAALLFEKIGLYAVSTAALVGATQGRQLWREFKIVRVRLQKREAK
jgi:PST family polysaccharide transporter